MLSDPHFHDRPDTLPPEPGAYALLIALERDLPLRLPGKPERVLAPGRYLYCGSARGPGGLRARVGRHFRRDKTERWHIDRLTAAGRMLGAWIVPGGDECALVATLSGLPVPVPGFGSSDCRRCASHLLHWPDGTPIPFPRPPFLRLQAGSGMGIEANCLVRPPSGGYSLPSSGGGHEDIDP